MTREECIDLMTQIYKVGYRLGELKAFGDVSNADLTREARHQSEALYDQDHVGLTLEQAYRIAYGHDLPNKTGRDG